MVLVKEFYVLDSFVYCWFVGSGVGCWFEIYLWFQLSGFQCYYYCGDGGQYGVVFMGDENFIGRYCLCCLDWDWCCGCCCDWYCVVRGICQCYVYCQFCLYCDWYYWFEDQCVLIIVLIDLDQFVDIKVLLGGNVQYLLFDFWGDGWCLGQQLEIVVIGVVDQCVMIFFIQSNDVIVVVERVEEGNFQCGVVGFFGKVCYFVCFLLYIMVGVIVFIDYVQVIVIVWVSGDCDFFQFVFKRVVKVGDFISGIQIVLNVEGIDYGDVWWWGGCVVGDRQE